MVNGAGKSTPINTVYNFFYFRNAQQVYSISA